MNYELISSLARLRCADILREAGFRRVLRSRTAPRRFRSHVGRAVRRVGRAAVTLGDALAESR